MHDTAYLIGGLVMETYLPATPAKILEIGSQDVNGSLRAHAPRNASYTGLDFEAGKGVDIVVTGLSDWNVEDAAFDLVAASSVFEHDKAFWRTFLAMCAKTKPGGHIYVSAPSNGTVHRYPQDYWRFYPDAGLALQEWALDEGFKVSLVESFIAERQAEVWNDFCAVFRREPTDEPLNRDFVHQKVACTNVLTWRSSLVLNAVDDSQDTRLLQAAREEQLRWVYHSNHLTERHAEEMAAQVRQIAALGQQVDEQAQRLAHLDGMAEELASLHGRMEDLQAVLAHSESEADRFKAEAEDGNEARARLEAETLEVREKLAASMAEARQVTSLQAQIETAAAHLEKSLASYAPGSSSDRPGEAAAVVSESAKLVLVSKRASGMIEQMKADLEKSDMRLAEVEDDLSECRERQDEGHVEIASLSDLVAETQDRVAELEQQNIWLRETGRFILDSGSWWWRFMPVAWQRRKRDARLLRRDLFDAEAYSRRYPDVASSGQDPLRHFIHHGIGENRRYD